MYVLGNMLPLLLMGICFVLGLGLSALLGAMVVRVCSHILKLGEIPFLNAFKSVGIAMFVNFVLNFIVGFNQGIMLATSRMQSYGSRYGYSEIAYQFFTPTFFLHSMLASIFLSAIFLCLLVERKNNRTKLTFIEASSLSALSAAVGITACTILAGSIFVLLWFVTRIG